MTPMHAQRHPSAGLYVHLQMPDAPRTPAQIIDWVDRCGHLVIAIRELLEATATTRHALEAFWDGHDDEVVLARIGRVPVLMHDDEIGTSVPWNPLEGIEQE